MNKVYISGKISGIPLEDAIRKFEQASQDVIALGLWPINPMNNGLDRNDEWEEHMLADIRLLFKTKTVLMLPCWRESRGARIEHFIAVQTGKEIFYNKITDKNMLTPIDKAADHFGITVADIKKIISAGHIVACVEASPGVPPSAKVSSTDLDRYFAENPHTLIEWQNLKKSQR